MDQWNYKKLVSGESRGRISGVLRALLKIISVFYRAGVDARNWLFDTGRRGAYSVTLAGLITTDRTQAAVPVVSVGNITVGGTGKTPLVVWLCNLLRAENINCAILTRGYKAKKDGKTDEPAILAQNCPGTAVVVNADRLAGALEAVKRHRAQVLVMDDGFQHRRLHRDIDIVTVDATQPFGYNKVLPAGLLREPVVALKRADAVVITRCDLVSQDALKGIEETVSRINPAIVIARAIYAPVCVRTAKDEVIPIEQLKGRKVYAFCGIANPKSFLTTVGRAGVSLVGSKIYDDHHSYTSRDVGDILGEATRLGTEVILTTEKDYNKIAVPKDSPSELVFAYLAVNMQFTQGEDGIIQLIKHLLAGRIPQKRTA